MNPNQPQQNMMAQGGMMPPQQGMAPGNNMMVNAQGMGSAAMAANQVSPISPNRDNPLSTQATLLISELRDNVVIMKDGSFRAVIACQSVNFWNAAAHT